MLNKKSTTTKVPGLKGKDFSYRYFHQLFIVGLLIAMMLVMCILSDSFRSLYNLGNLINSCFPLVLCAIGQMLVIMTAGIDISVGSMMALGNCASVFLMTKYSDMSSGKLAVITLIVTIIIGLLAGTLNGVCVAKFRLPAIIVTIATGAIFKGICLVLMPVPGGDVTESLKNILKYKFADSSPIALPIMIVVVLLFAYITNHTSLGMAIRSVGGNESAAFGTGVNVERAKIVAYSLCGLLCALAGLFMSARTSSADPSIGDNYTVYSISATVVGGTLMTGAVGQSYGTACGAAIILLINNILNMLNISSYYQYVCQGAILVLALSIASIETRRNS